MPRSSTIRALGAAAAAVAALRFRQHRRRARERRGGGGGGDAGRLAPSRVRRGSAGPARLRALVVATFVILMAVGLHGAWRGANRRANRRARPAAAVTAPPGFAPSGGDWDVIVAGAGPAGLSAALYAGRAGLSTLVLGSGAGALAEAATLANFPGRGGGGGGDAWLDRARAQAAAAGAVLAPGALATSLAPQTGGGFAVGVDGGGRASARAVVVATGATPRRLGLAGEAALWGRSLHSCAICDGGAYADKVVVVVGGGDAAVEAAGLVARFAARVYLVHRGLRASDVRAYDAVAALDRVEVLAPYEVAAWRVDRGALAAVAGARRERVQLYFNMSWIQPSSGFLRNSRRLPCAEIMGP